MNRNFSFAIRIGDKLYIMRVAQTGTNMTVDMFDNETFMASLTSTTELTVPETFQWATDIVEEFETEKSLKDSELLRINAESLSKSAFDYSGKYN